MAVTLTTIKGIYNEGLQFQEKHAKYFVFIFLLSLFTLWPFGMRIKHQLLEAASPGITTADIELFRSSIKRQTICLLQTDC